jgi:ketosteroid isomerase-like protein
MHPLFAFVGRLFVLTLLAGAAHAADPDLHADDRKELLKIFREIEASINAQNVDRMVQQMAPDATVTWLNGEVSRGHAEIKAYYDRMVKGEKRILDKYTTAAKVAAPARFFGDVAVADGTTEDEFFPSHAARSG